MIVRKYARRTRCVGRSCADTTLSGGGGGAALDLEDSDFGEPRFSQDNSSQDPFSLPAFSSQDSSPWSLDPDLSLPLSFELPNDDPSTSRPGKRPSGRRDVRKPAAGAGTATLMEAQEFGEMMEHVDEVNFALDGLRAGQPARIRRASLLSLLSICSTAHQRRLLRAQGMAKRIVDAILGLNFDDSPSAVAAAALFYILASDVQDDHLLDSPSCIRFLLKLLNPLPVIVEGKAPTIGCKLLGIRKHHLLGGSDKGTDSSSRAIISKVLEILLNSKEIKSINRGDSETERPELCSKWIALLTMEKACLSPVSFEDTSDMVKKSGETFKEKLRELGGLDAIFDVVVSCHSTMEGWFKHNSPSVLDMKGGVALQSLVLLLKCLKIMENATFLSKDNQDHLLGMNRKLCSEGFPRSFVGIVLSAIKLFSDISLLRCSTISNNGKSNFHSKSVGTHLNAPDVHANGSQTDIRIGISSSDKAGPCGSEDSHIKSIKVCHKRQRLSATQSEVSVSDRETTSVAGSDVCSIKNRTGFSRSVSCNGALSGSNGEGCINSSVLKVKMNGNDSKVNSHRGSCGRFSVKANANTSSGSLSVRPHIPEGAERESMKDNYDPFSFDEEDLEPSKWELLARKNETSQTHQRTILDRKLLEGFESSIIATDQELNQLGNEKAHLPFGSSFPSAAEDSDIVEDCLLSAVKVLMNLTNDNPVGCQQIATCGGLDTMASLIVSHFPSFDLFIPLRSQLEENMPAADLSMDDSHLNNRHLTGQELDFLVAILGLLVNLVEKDSRNRSRLASARISVERSGISKNKESCRDVITILCCIFLANQGAGEAAGEGKFLLCDESSLLQGEREAEMMIIEAYSALLLAFLSTESTKVREAIARCLPNHSLQVLVPVLERFVAFHLTLNMISPETHSAVIKVIESCKGP